MTEIIKNKSFKIIAYIDTDSTGKKIIKNSSFKICGYYDPKTNITKDSSFRIVGYGNLLMTLI